MGKLSAITLGERGLKQSDLCLQEATTPDTKVDLLLYLCIVQR